MKYVTPAEAANYLGVSTSTLRRWEKEGRIKSIRTPGNQRRFCLNEYLELPEAEKQTILYARVSTHSQQDDLARQAELLQSKYPTGKLITEVGSGLNFRRRKFISILERVYKGDVQCLVCAYPDRLARFGFPLIEWLCSQAQCQLVVLNEKTASPEQELVEDILSILHCFSARLYGLRRYKQKVEESIQEKTEKPNHQVNTEQCLQDTGVSL